MVTKPPDTGVELKIKVLPPDECELPPAIFSNFVFINRQDGQTMLVFTHVHGPLNKEITEEQRKKAEEEGVRPTVVSVVVLPTETARGLLSALESVTDAGSNREGNAAL